MSPNCVALWECYFQYGGKSDRNRSILTKHLLTVRPSVFPCTINKCNLTYTESAEVFGCTYLLRIQLVFKW